MIRVAWNLLWLRPGVVGGSEEYATRQLDALATLGSGDVDVSAFVLAPFLDAHPALASRVRCVAVGLDGRSKPRRVLAETTWLARRSRTSFDVVHHVGGRIPLVAPGTRVLTVHDLQPLEQPENFSPVKRAFLGRAIPRSVGRAAAIVTPSEHVRGKVIERFALDPARVFAIAAPVRAIDRTAVAHGAGALDVPADLRPLLDGTHPYVLYPAFTYPHKNHLVLLDAFARVRRTHADARLVLTLGAGGHEAMVQERLARPDLAGAVVRPGRVTRPLLDALLLHAAALAFPSRYEGFGLPVVEALTAGCPVLASDLPVLREVLDGAGVLLDPDDPVAWAAAIGAALDARADGGTDGRVDGGTDAARERAVARYSPESTVRALVGAYRAAVGW